MPNSYIDATNPTGSLDNRYFRGSGTSESAAVASGAVALVLQKYPKMTPDQVKAFFKDNAFTLTGPSPLAQGNGELNLTKMLVGLLAPLQIAPRSSTSGREQDQLEAARGQDHLTRDGVVLTGEQDIFGQPFNAAAMAKLEASGNSWSRRKVERQQLEWKQLVRLQLVELPVWTGNSWSASSWSASSWSASS